MATRRPSIVNAGVELGFVVLALALGALSAPLWALIALVAVMIAYWIWSRRGALAAMTPGALIGSSALSIAVLAAVLTSAYFGAREVSGWMG